MEKMSSLNSTMSRGGRNRSNRSRRFTTTLNSRVKNRSDVPPFTGNFRAIVLLSRLLGCHPHAISSKKFVESTKFAKIHSILSFLLVLVILATCEIKEFADDRTGYRKIDTPTNIHNAGVLVNYVVCSIVQTVRAGHFDEGTAKIREFDGAAANSPRGNTHAAENIVAATLVISTWSLIAWINAPFDNIATRPHLVAYPIFTGVLTLEIYKFCFVFAALLRHFARLNKIVSSGKIFVVSKGRVDHRAPTVRDVFVLRQWLMDSVESFNKYYDVQIVYWFSFLVSNLIMQASVMASGSRKRHVESRDLARFALTFYHLLLLCVVPHFACKRANELGKLLFGHGVRPLKTTFSPLENFELGLYLWKKPLKITALRMFSVDLPLLLSIVEAFATFTTFILQMSSKGG